MYVSTECHYLKFCMWSISTRTIINKLLKAFYCWFIISLSHNVENRYWKCCRFFFNYKLCFHVRKYARHILKFIYNAHVKRQKNGEIYTKNWNVCIKTQIPDSRHSFVRDLGFFSVVNQYFKSHLFVIYWKTKKTIYWKFNKNWNAKQTKSLQTTTNKLK